MPYKTVIVLGAARGGTSMTAGTLAKLGIYMGDDLSVLYEDSALNACVKEKDKRRAKTIVKERNDKYAVWGVKQNSVRLWSWLRLFREPVYVVVFRDILATANRRVIALERTLFVEMLLAIGQNLFFLILLSFTKRPVLAISYEKALLYPEDFVSTVCRFLGIDDSEKYSEVIEFIQPSPSAYRNRKRISLQLDKSARWFGCVDEIEATKVTGWALSIVEKKPLAMELIVGGVRVATTLADLPRPDVLQADKRFTAICGFEFQLSEPQTIKAGHRVEVKIARLAFNLPHSPTIIPLTTE